MNKIEKTKTLPGSIVIPGGRTGVLLIHSLGGTPVELRFVAQSLARLGYTVHCPLLPGLGANTDISGLSTWKDWYAGVQQAHDALREDCDTVLVGGLSAGAMLALKLAADRPADVKALMLFAPTIFPNGWAIPKSLHLFKLVHDRYIARLFKFSQRAPYGIKDERIRNFMLDSFKGDNRSLEDLFGRGGGMVLEFRRLVRQVKKQLGTITQQTVIFHPRFDDQSDLKNTMLLQRRLGGLVEVAVLDDSYHMVTLDRQRGYVVDRTVEFAARIVARIEEQAQVERMKQEAAGKTADKVVAAQPPKRKLTAAPVLAGE
jgi:carboxylesterase